MSRARLALALLLLCGNLQAASLEVGRPEPFVFGSSVADMQARLAPLCTRLKVREITPPTAPLARISQHQIDCEGFAWAGKPRKVELVFQDNQLDIAWILFPADEKQAFVDAFTERYGKPSLQVDFGVVFLAAGAAVRNTPTEVLFASERQARAMMATLRAQAAPSAPSTDATAEDRP